MSAMFLNVSLFQAKIVLRRGLQRWRRRVLLHRNRSKRRFDTTRSLSSLNLGILSPDTVSFRHGKESLAGSGTADLLPRSTYTKAELGYLTRLCFSVPTTQNEQSAKSLTAAISEKDPKRRQEMQESLRHGESPSLVHSMSLEKSLREVRGLRNNPVRT